jgi:hypothetical protein
VPVLSRDGFAIEQHIVTNFIEKTIHRKTSELVKTQPLSLEHHWVSTGCHGEVPCQEVRLEHTVCVRHDAEEVNRDGRPRGQQDGLRAHNHRFISVTASSTGFVGRVEHEKTSTVELVVSRLPKLALVERQSLENS